MTQIVQTIHVSSDEDSSYAIDTETEKRFKNRHYSYFIDKLMEELYQRTKVPYLWDNKANTEQLLHIIFTNISKSLRDKDEYPSKDISEYDISIGMSVLSLLTLLAAHKIKLGDAIVEGLG